MAADRFQYGIRHAQLCQFRDDRVAEIVNPQTRKIRLGIARVMRGKKPRSYRVMVFLAIPSRSASSV
jgi:hypothetical protein